jgi:subtilisin family serine protease
MTRAVALAMVAGLLLAVAGVAAPAGATPGPPDAKEYWFDSWHLQQLWSRGDNGRGITIAEIDTGVNASLPGLRGRILDGTDLGAGGDGHIDRDKQAFGHGTAMASIMVSRPSSFDVTGIAPGARILPIAVPLIGTTDVQSDDHLAAAIRYAADHHAKIISMSLGGTRKPGGDTQACYADEQSAIYYALRKGVLLFAASGNAGRSGSPVEEPGVCLGVIFVGATNPDGSVAGFSSKHPYLTLSAPGVDIPSLGRIEGEAYSGEGTSQATAIASAATAILWSARPKDSAQAILGRLLATTDHHSATPNDSYGYGIINPYRAITATVAADAPNAVYALAEPFSDRDEATGSGPSGTIPAPIHAIAGPPGPFRIGSTPSPISSQVRAGALGAALGLVLLIALVIGGARRARTRSTAAAAEAAVPRPPPVLDAEGVEWHQL